MGGRDLVGCFLVALLVSSINAFSTSCPGALKLRSSAMPQSAARVGIVGAGIAGCSLAKVLKETGLAVTVFEMGRGAGGRMATRKSREIPGLAINHGAPVFSASHEEFLRMLRPLIDAGAVKRWNGTVSSLDASSLTTTPSSKYGGESYVGSPDMSSVCEALLNGVETRFQTQVASIERKEKEWLLRNKDDQELGRFDWLCVTSHTMGHPRWEKVFGFAPPLETLSKQIPSLKPLAAPLKDVVSTPVMVTMTSYPAEGAAADALARLPADILDVTGHPSVSRVSRQSAGGFISLVVHSTADFAARFAHVYGSTSAAARLSADKWKTEDAKAREQEVLAELHGDASALLLRLNASPPDDAAPVLGPVLHRWGSAFCSTPEGSNPPVVDAELGLAVCGDWTASPPASSVYNGVEASAVSGLALGRTIISRL